MNVKSQLVSMFGVVLECSVLFNDSRVFQSADPSDESEVVVIRSALLNGTIRWAVELTAEKEGFFTILDTPDVGFAMERLFVPGKTVVVGSNSDVALFIHESGLPFCAPLAPISSAVQESAAPSRPMSKSFDYFGRRG